MSRSVEEQVGLTREEAIVRLTRDGFNELPSAKPRSLWAIAWEVVREPMFLLLLGASAIYLVLGDIREALVLFASVFVVMGITFYQERKTERALEALRELASPRAKVWRDGEWQLVPGREVVVGDLVLVKEGDRVPADAVLLTSSNLMADESLLTGESVPVRKRASEAEPAAVRPGGDDLPYVFSGTLLTQGQGLAHVVATGMRTEIGKIGKALQTLVPESSTIQRETRRAVLFFAVIGIALCVLVTVLYGLMRGDWLNGLLAGITLAMANLPEEFPVVLTVFLALGAWRISQARRADPARPGDRDAGIHDRVVRGQDRHPNAEPHGGESPLGAGQRTRSADDRGDVSAGTRRTECPGERTGTLRPDGEGLPPARAGARAGSAREAAARGRLGTATRCHLRSCPLPMSGSHQETMGTWWPLKAPRRRSRSSARSTPPQRAALQTQVARMAGDGLRVLAVARGTLSPTYASTYPWPSSQRELRLQFVGLTGLADPIRPTVPVALRECYAAGIRTVMITGDYPGTAVAIARQIGLADPEMVVTGPELDAMTDAQLRERVGQVNIFARVVPEQKLRLVQALKANGEIVAMTGDGVNDAPALKAAHIGVAMGERGSDVAREAASLVLLDDDFASMVEAVKLGRRIFDNIQKAMGYILAVHVPTAGMALLPLFFGWPLVFYPVHIVFLEFVIDPACSIAFEAEPPERDVMRRPPRSASSRLFNGWMIATSVLQGRRLVECSSPPVRAGA